MDRCDLDLGFALHDFLMSEIKFKWCEAVCVFTVRTHSLCVSPPTHGFEVSQKLSDGKDLLLDLNKIMGKDFTEVGTADGPHGGHEMS